LFLLGGDGSLGGSLGSLLSLGSRRLEMRVASELVNCNTGLKGEGVRADTNSAARPLGGRGGALRIGGRSLLLTRLMCEDKSTEVRIGDVLLDGETGTLDVEMIVVNVLTSLIPGLETLGSHDV
jgi:hypothetical protein